PECPNPCPYYMDKEIWRIFLRNMTLFDPTLCSIIRKLMSFVGFVRGTTMTRAKVGAGVLLMLFGLGLGANSTPQDTPQKPAVCATIDSAVKGISGYNMKDQSALSDDGEFLRRVMLDIVGYPPNLEQVQAFIKDA